MWLQIEYLSLKQFEDSNLGFHNFLTFYSLIDYFINWENNQHINLQYNETK